MSASASPRLHFAKPQKGKRIRVRPSKTRKHPSARMKARASLERSENKKVKARSEGQCEALVLIDAGVYGDVALRCARVAVHIHHEIGGHGKRGVGASALAENKKHLCALHHREIHDGKLKPVGDGTYRRAA